ncbi:hypothetical protein F7U75_22505 [Vibrio vulnificus]|nr:hypothetical protein [Vibrio vulnificus]
MRCFIKIDSFYSQVLKSFVFKFSAIALSFYFIRLSLDYLEVSRYAIWAVQLSIINLLLFLDFGVGNSLKNELVKALSKHETKLVKEYISTAYFFISMILSIVYAIFFIVSDFVDWNVIFNNSNIQEGELRGSIRIIVFAILLNMILCLINAISSAYNKNYYLSLGNFLSQLCSVVSVSLLIANQEPSLIYISMCYGSSICISSLVLNLHFFYSNPEVCPKYGYVKVGKHFRLLISTGLIFLVLQLMFFFIQSNDRFLVSQLLTSYDVTEYDLLAKYFSILLVVHGLINAPLWPIYGRAYLDNDYRKLIVIFKRLVVLMFFYLIIGCFMLFFSDWFISSWVGYDYEFSLKNKIICLIMYLVLIVFSIFAYFSNGIGKLKVQLYSIIAGAIVNIPLTIFFVKEYNMGIDGVMLATILSLLIFCLLGACQVRLTILSMKGSSKS